MPAPPPASSPLPRQSGFTLIEILVVISSIAILLGIGLFALERFAGEAERKTTLVVLQGALTAEAEYEARVPSGVSAAIVTLIDGATGNLEHNSGGNGSGSPASMSEVEKYVWVILRMPAAAEQFRAGVKPQFLTDNDSDGFLELRDGWGNEIVYANGAVAVSGIPDHPSPYLASAGPDGDFGTEDDVYSFDVD